MNIMEVTNLLLKKLYQSNLEVELELSLDDTVSNAVQVQINIKPKYFNDFAIFYGTKDAKINFSSIFDIDKKDLKAEQLFKENSGIFNDFIYDEDGLIHLFTEIEVDKFYLECETGENLNDSVIDVIINYLKEEHELTNYLNSIEK